ncbi:MAG: alkaline phosphatase family protein [Burkholderiales bacterium]
MPLAISTSLVAQNQLSAQKSSSIPQGIHNIRHVIIIMQENRSFDSYFGTFPGADGLPTKDGAFTVCNPDPKSGQCIGPYHDANDINGGGPHFAISSLEDIDNGRMDGFIVQAKVGRKGCKNLANPACTNSVMPDVMGYHDGRDIPNYWSYARTFVLQDHMFEPNATWSLPAHLYEISAWSPDELIDLMQTGDRLSYHPENVSAELVHFHNVLPQAIDKVHAMAAAITPGDQRKLGGNWRSDRMQKGMEGYQARVAITSAQLQDVSNESQQSHWFLIDREWPMKSEAVNSGKRFLE